MKEKETKQHLQDWSRYAATQRTNLSSGIAKELNENIDILVDAVGYKITSPKVMRAVVALQTVASILQKGGLR